MRIIIEGVKANHIHLPTFITFIEFKKAFDSIHRVKMMRILKAYGTKPNLPKAIERVYSNTMAKTRVMTPDGETEQFDITAGVLQGYILASLGFTIKPRRSRKHQKEVMTDHNFANDIAMLSDAIQQAQNSSSE